MSRSIAEWQAEVHKLAVRSGWHEGELTQERLITMLAMIHAEVSEAIHCVRDNDTAARIGEAGKPEGFPAELADVVLRALCVAAWAGVDLEAAMVGKHAFNEKRPRGTVLRAGKLRVAGNGG